MKYPLLVLLLTICTFSFSQTTKQEYASMIETLCREINENLQQINIQMKAKTEDINSILNTKNQEISSLNKKNSRQITELSKQIQVLAKKIQRIYDSKIYIQYCMILAQQMGYKDFTPQELKKGYQQLKTLQTNNLPSRNKEIPKQQL